MVRSQDKKIDNIEKLVEIIATSTLKLTEDITEVKKDMTEVKKDIVKLEEGQKDIRMDILNLGNRFSSQFAFDNLSSRVYALEKKVMSKK